MSLSQTFNQDSLGNIGIAAAATTAAPSYSNGTVAALSLTLAGLLRVDGSGVTQPVSATTLPLPTGASTSALQTSGNSTLSAISLQLPTTLGQKTSANSLSVVIASDNTVAVSAVSLPLPTGAATAALQTSGNATLTAISGQLPATLGPKVSASSFSVVLASDEIVPVSLPIATTAAQTSVASSSTSVTLLAANANRRAFFVFNDSTQILYVSFTATSTAAAYSVKLFPNSCITSDFIYTGIISGIWASANGAAKVTEFT